MILEGLLCYTSQILSFQFWRISLSFPKTNFFEINRGLHTILLNLAILGMIIDTRFFSVHPIMVSALHLVLSNYFLKRVPWTESFLLFSQHHIGDKLRNLGIFIINSVMNQALFKVLSIIIFSNKLFLLSYQLEISSVRFLSMSLYLRSLHYAKVKWRYQIFFVAPSTNWTNRLFPRCNSTLILLLTERGCFNTLLWWAPGKILLCLNCLGHVSAWCLFNVLVLFCWNAPFLTASRRWRKRKNWLFCDALLNCWLLF